MLTFVAVWLIMYINSSNISIADIKLRDVCVFKICMHYFNIIYYMYNYNKCTTLKVYSTFQL